MSDPDDQRAFEARSKAAFDASVGALDAATKSRLTQARVRALAELPATRRTRWGAPWLVTAGAAVAALAAWLVLVPRSPSEQPVQIAALSDLEVLLAEEDLELIEELDFYAWLEGQLELESAVDGDGVG